MILKLILFIFGATQILGADITNQEYYDPNDDNNTLLITSMFSKLNTILLENREISKRQGELTENIASLTRSMKISLERQEQQETKTKELANNVASITGSMKTSLDKQESSIKNLTEDIALITKTINKSEGRQAQENFEKALVEDNKSIKKYINQTLYENGDWTVIQRRQDGSEDFNRTWAEYKRGFGNPNGEFFIGLEKLHALTTYSAPQELLIVLEDFHNQTRYAKYSNLVIDNETEKYKIKELGKYSGDVGDSLQNHKGLKFSTYDQDNDTNSTYNCAKDLGAGGWWYYYCYSCNLNGKYNDGPEDFEGIKWNSWYHKQSLKFVEMMIRRKS